MVDADALAFGEAAELYDAARPGYPSALFDAVLASVPRVARVLEIGAGTGKATVALVARDVEVDAIEPDPRMAAVARSRTAGLRVRVHEVRFEDWAGAPAAFDVVACAQVWHWLDPIRAAAVAARALRAEGALAVWWTRPRAVCGPVLAAVREAYGREARSLLDRTSLLAVRPGVDVPAPLPGFEPWRTESFRWRQVYDADAYARLIRTQPDHRRLGEERLAALERAVRRAIDDAGEGAIAYDFSTDLSIAALTPGPRRA